MSSTFYEQLGGVTGVFEQWGACERTAVLCALVRRLPWSGLKMLQRTVEEALVRDTPPAADGEQLECDANDDAVLTDLLTTQTESEDTDERWKALQRLVTLAPLTHSSVLTLVAAAPALVQQCVETQKLTHLLLMRQLLTYLLVHPNLQAHHHHQTTISHWLRYVENHVSNNTNSDSYICPRFDGPLFSTNNIWGSNSIFRRTIGKNLEFRTTFDSMIDKYNGDLQESFSKNGRDVDLSVDDDKLSFDVTISQPKSQRSNSLTPPVTNFMQTSSSAENLNEEPLLQKPRSFSLSSEHSLGQMKPISAMYGTTGSETRLDELRSNNCLQPGMSNVGPWLKSLRLHKYVWLFSNVTYDQMLAMDEKYLEKLGVTLGARHKLLLSIAAAAANARALQALQQAVAARGVAAAGGARALLRAVRRALLAPLPPRGAAPAALVCLLDAVSKALLSTNGTETFRGMRRGMDLDDDGECVDPISLHCWLVEKALHHECFQAAELSEPLKRLRYRLPPRQFYTRVGGLPAPRPRPRPRPAPRPRPRPRSPPRTPPRTPLHLHSSLDALCLQMTQQAID